VTVDCDVISEDSNEACTLKIQGDSVELNVHADRQELLGLARIRDAQMGRHAERSGQELRLVAQHGGHRMDRSPPSLLVPTMRSGTSR
jgi:hypothetical protein